MLWWGIGRLARRAPEVSHLMGPRASIGATPTPPLPAWCPGSRHDGPIELSGLLHPGLPYRNPNRRFSTHTGMPVWRLSRQPGAAIPAPAGRSSQARTGGTGSSMPCSTRPQPPRPRQRPTERRGRARRAERWRNPRSGQGEPPTPYRCTSALNVLSFEPAWFISLWVLRKSWRPCATVLIGSGNVVHNLRMLRN
jgi:hypothetical protein